LKTVVETQIVEVVETQVVEVEKTVIETQVVEVEKAAEVRTVKVAWPGMRRFIP
jgi:hypothetical protein